MSSKLDISLDDIIKSKPRNRQRNHRNSGPGRNDRKRENKATAAAPYSKPGNAQKVQGATISDSGRILITNLHHNVTERDLRELFSQVGQVRAASLNFDSRGQSQGSGMVIFSRGNDALAAFRKYHGVTLDGRPMKIAIPFIPANEASVPISSRVGPVRNQPITKNNVRGNQRSSKPNPRRKKEPRANKSKEDLDAELDAYNAVS